MAVNQISISKIFSCDSQPINPVVGRFWYDTINKKLHYCNGTSWIPISISSDDVGILQDGSKISLTTYLNNQFSVVGEALDSLESNKQDNLINYSESTGSNNEQISTISVSSSSDTNSKINLIASGVNGGDINISTTSTGSDDQSKINLSSDKIYLSGYGVYVNAPVFGEVIDDSIATLSNDDTHIPTSKAVNDAINTAVEESKLLYYSETSGDTPSATISVANIKLTGKVAEGSDTAALGAGSHAEGNYTTASGYYSHAEGYHTIASGNYSHAEGGQTTASGAYSHAEGLQTAASGATSHVEGDNTLASSGYQHAQGKYNIEDANDKYADIIGNGSSIDARSNAATVSWDGISWSQTDVRAGGTDQDNAIHSLSNKQNILEYIKEKQGDSQSNTIITSVGGESIQHGGDISISTGTGSASSGNMIIETSETESALSETGYINIQSGGSTLGSTGDITIQSGTTTHGRSGDVYIKSGHGFNTGSIILTPTPCNELGGGGSSGTIELNNSVSGTAVDSVVNTNSSDTHIPTSKAVNDAINKLQIQSSTQLSVTPTAIQEGYKIDSENSNACRITVNPKITNVGAIYISESSTYSNINPIYPDQICSLSFSNIGQVYVYVDVIGDSVDLFIENYGY